MTAVASTAAPRPAAYMRTTEAAALLRRYRKSDIEALLEWAPLDKENGN